MNEKQLDHVRHMLGINDPYVRTPKPYRNYAAVNPGDPEYLELEQLGMIERYQPRWPSDYHYYRCTESGKLAAMQSHRTIRKTKAQRKYSAFLDMVDCIPDTTFKEFLINPEFADIRANA